MNEIRIEPKVSILVLNFNGKRHLGERLFDNLQALLQTHYDEFEVLLVDNGSTDCSEEEIRNRFRGNPELHVVKLDRNYGFATGNNKGFACLNRDSKYVAFLNNDVCVRKDWLEHTIEAFENNPSIGMIGCKQYGPDGFRFYGGVTDMLGFTYFRASRGFPAQQVSFCGGAAFVIRRELFERLGGFDDSFFLLFEEVDLCWRIWLAGYSVIQLSNSVARHDISASSHGMKLELHSTKNRLRTLIKNYEISHAFLYSSILTVLYLGYTFVAMVRSRERSSIFYPRAIVWNLIHLRNTWTDRMQVQRHRKISDRELCSRKILIRPRITFELGRSVHNFINV